MGSKISLKKTVCALRECVCSEFELMLLIFAKIFMFYLRYYSIATIFDLKEMWIKFAFQIML